MERFIFASKYFEMLVKFTVQNFKGFRDKFIFDLENSNSYSFNSNLVKDGIINNAIIYGKNGVGKSNLGLGLMDIINQISDKFSGQQLYSNYLNGDSNDQFAEFEYIFKLNESKVRYFYRKEEFLNPVYESLEINGRLVAKIDRLKDDRGFVSLKGTETLNTQLSNKNLSLVKYIKNNSQLEDNEENRAFIDFYEYVERMLFFRSLDKNNFIGWEDKPVKDVVEDLIQRDDVGNFEAFLNAAGIKCKLKVENSFDKDVLFFKFKNKYLPFKEIASTGTRSLTLFYYWLQRLKSSKSAFVFIDEFDAFYHFELSKMLVKELIKSEVQFVLTTHNISILSNDILRPDCYFEMEENKINAFSKLTSKELRKAHNLEKMYKAGAFYGK